MATHDFPIKTQNRLDGALKHVKFYCVSVSTPTQIMFISTKVLGALRVRHKIFQLVSHARANK